MGLRLGNLLYTEMSYHLRLLTEFLNTSNLATEVIMQSRKLEATGKAFRLAGDQTIYILAFLIVIGSWIRPETFPGYGEAKVACPSLSSWSDFWFDIPMSSFPIRVAAILSSKAKNPILLMTKVLVWHPTLLSSHQRWNPPKPEATYWILLGAWWWGAWRVCPLLLPCLPHWSQAHPLGSGYQSSRILAVCSPSPHTQHKQVHSLFGLFLEEKKGSSIGSHEISRQTVHLVRKVEQEKGVIAYFLWKECTGTKFPLFL